ncbi:MAG: hypothetical protein KBD78_04030 [Oligoflexales bacterium]|nr:hypothetical protein [Oligoflexales bacterium]
MTIDTNRHIAEIINSKFRVIKKLQKYVSETQAQIEDQMDKLEKIIDDLVWCEIHECERDHLCKGCKRYQETGYMHECEHGPYDDECKKCHEDNMREDDYRDGLVFDSIFGGSHA